MGQEPAQPDETDDPTDPTEPTDPTGPTSPEATAGPTGAEETLRCDFCGEETSRVRRVALDRDYDRLQMPHPVRYACERCSREKERERQGG